MIPIRCGEEVRLLTQDLYIFNKLNLERPPVGVSFLFFRPEGIDQLPIDKNLSLCEMLREAQQTGATDEQGSWLRY
jgi:hypothetical protein